MRQLLPTLLLAFVISGCRKDVPVWNKKIFVGSSQDKALVRKQSNEVIPADTIEFDKYVCVKKEDFDCLVETYIVNAKGWKKQSACGVKP